MSVRVVMNHDGKCKQGLDKGGGTPDIDISRSGVRSDIGECDLGWDSYYAARCWRCARA